MGKNMKKTSIYVVGHKKFKYPTDTMYIPIQVGKVYSGNDLKILSDDTGDNIAEKNKTFCELTAVYWIWKNDHNSDIVGLCHYRRYFTNSKLFASEKFFLKEKDILALLSKYDAIVTEKMNWTISVREFYSACAGKDKDIELTRQIIQQKYPEYLGAFDKIMTNNGTSYCNMVICSKYNWDKYCEWLFDILFSLESIVDLSTYTVQEARVFGYLAELLMNVWLEYNGLNVVEVPMVNTEYSFKHRLRRYAKRYFKFIK